MRRSARLPLEALAPYLLTLPESPGFLEVPQVFGNDRPVEIEVGFGKGLFLLTESQARPDINFLGIEVLRKYQLLTATRFAKRKQGNVRLAHADARLFLRDRVAPASVAVVHVYFPDPWWKTRHRKRRLFTADFVAEVERVLCLGGRLSLATDVADYFAIMQQLASRPAFRPLPPPEPLDFLTNFERKFRLQGLPIFRALYERTN